MKLYDDTDHEWIASIVDQLVACEGLPWRTMRERVEHGPVRSDKAAAILGAMRRIMGGRADRMRIARKLRAIVLGTPALDAESRAQRFSAAEEELGVAVDELESLLWIDLADERPVALPGGRPDEMKLAAFANVDRVARYMRRAHRVRIHTGDDSQPLVRAARRFGLIASVHPRPGHPDGLVTTLDILGPLSLFHATRVYGRALAAIVPYLAHFARFVVEIDAEFGYGPASLRVVSPALLPPAPADDGPQRLATRIQAALAKEAVQREREREREQKHDADHGPALAVTLDPVGVTLDPVTVTLDPVTVTLDPVTVTLDPVTVTLDPVTVTLDPVAVTLAPVTVTLDPVAVTLDPVGVTLDPVGVTLDPVTVTLDPVTVTLDPSPVVGPNERLFPDLLLRRGSTAWFVEIVGFATAELLQRKLTKYEAAGENRVILLVDERYAAPHAIASGDRRILFYRSRSVAKDLLAIMEVP